MALLSAANVSRAGVDVAGVTPTAGTGDTFANTGAEVVVIKNGSGAGITATLDITATVDGAAVTDPAVSIGAGVTKIIGPFPTGIYGSVAKITCSAVVTVEIKVLKQIVGV